MRSWIFLLLLALLACAPSRPVVVVYCSLDQLYAEPILQRFERETGIRVLAKYDLEATKTTGLVNQLLAEAKHPRCDLFWNNEMLQTLELKRRGLLEPYRSPGAAGIPPEYVDPDGCWTGFAARLRVILYNRDRVRDHPPSRLQDLTDPRWKGRVGMARPLFGTTLTHWGALDQALGPEGARALLDQAMANGLVIVEGNAVVRDRVAAGDLDWGLTDSDDANGALMDGAHVTMVLPDQDGMGTLVIPNTVALIKGGPHPEEARRLLDFLLTPEVERELAAGRSRQIPLREKLTGIRAMQLDGERLLQRYPAVLDHLRERFLQ